MDSVGDAGPSESDNGEDRPGLKAVNNIVYLRAIAALSVLLFHTSFYYAQFTGNRHFLAIFSAWCGFFGVSMFFCISGYLMASLQEKSDLRSFVTARVVRIYPAFLVANVVALTIFHLRTGTAPGVSLAGLSLLPLGRQPRPLGIEWTLIYEIFYYILVAPFTIPALRNAFRPFLIIWLLSVVGYYVATGVFVSDMQPATLSAFLAIHNVSFILGALLRAYRFEAVFGFRFMAPFGLCAIATLGMLPIEAAKLFVGPCAILIIVGGAIRSTDLSDSALGRGLAGPLRGLGERSYALYLVHPTVLVTLFEVAVRHEVRGALLWLGALAAALWAGCAYGTFDLWLHRRLRAATVRSAGQVPPTWPRYLGARQHGRWASSPRGGRSGGPLGP